MRYLNWVRIRAGRFLFILFAIVVYFILLYVGGLHFFPGNGATSAKLVKFWFGFGSSSLIALIFIATGSLVWLFARDRRVALLLFCCSFTMMTTFAVETGAASTSLSLPNFISDISSLLSLALFAVFLTLFPRNYFSRVLSREKRRRHPVSYYVLRTYLVVMSLLCITTVAAVLPYYLKLLFSDTLYHSVLNFYLLFVLLGIIVTIILSYRGLPTLRERQQVRLFMAGVLLAFVPFLLLTIVPGVLPLLSSVALDAQVSTLTAIFLPLALGYSILRYQILVFDMYIRRIVAWIVGAVGLIILGYLVVVFTSVVPALNPAAYVAIAAFCLVVLAPLMWWLARVITERLFFNEIRHYRHFIEKPAQLASERFDMHEAAELLTLALVQAFEIDEVCLYVLDQESGYFQPVPDLDGNDQRDAARQRLARLLLETRQPMQEKDSTLQEVSRLPEGLALLTNVNNFKRPLLLSEANRPEGELPTGLARYLSTSETVANDPLLVPVRAQGKMIGLLVMGSRSDGQPYAGPDFEAIDLILGQFAPLLETARLYLQAHRDALALRDAYERLKELDKLKDQFIMTASHELRTPLTAVQGYIELLLNYNDRLGAEERAAFIAKAQRGCDELTLMVGNIMDASRVEVDVREVSLAPVPLADSVSHVLEIMEGVTRREKRRVELAIADDVVVEADELRLRQIILNLVGNALKYSAPGSPLEISAAVEDQLVTLRIRDYGRGVPLQDQARLFERFVRLERDMNSPVRGVGLGLAISKQLVEAMGGCIWVESSGEEGKGSVFAFSLKCGQAARVPAS